MTDTLGKLYKRGTKGEIRVWEVEIDGDKYRTIAGVFGGKLITSEWTTATPKNVGRSNELTAEQQAMEEAKAMFTKKLKSDYFTDPDDIDNKKMLKPMLAQKFDEYGTHITFPTYCQPKLDGFRANTKEDGFYSRKNEKYLNLDHLQDVLTIASKEGLTLDGELYNHDLADDFDQLQSLVMKKKPSPEDREAAKGVVQYHIYDIMDTEKTFQQRRDTLVDLFARYPELSNHCVLVETYVVSSRSELDKIYETMLEGGYEGQMVRANARYENKRSKTLLKRKEFEDHEYTIVEIQEGLGNRSGMAGAVLCSLADGRTFGAGIKGGVAYYRQLWAKRAQLVGRPATITHFKQLTPDGVPRFPVFKGVREDI